MTERQAAIAVAIERELPEVGGVEFDEDGQHVYVAVGGEAYTRRYRLGPNCQRFLAGEFPEGGLLLDLRVPGR
jgi:hypothetical protein